MALWVAHSGWVFVDSYKTQISQMGAWQKRQSLALVLGSKRVGFGSELMASLGAGKKGSDSEEPQDVCAGEILEWSEGN